MEICRAFWWVKQKDELHNKSSCFNYFQGQYSTGYEYINRLTCFHKVEIGAGHFLHSCQCRPGNTNVCSHPKHLKCQNVLKMVANGKLNGKWSFSSNYGFLQGQIGIRVNSMTKTWFKCPQLIRPDLQYHILPWFIYLFLSHYLAYHKQSVCLYPN